MSYEAQLVGIQARLKPLFEPIVLGIDKKKKEFKSYWHGENIIEKIAVGAQKRVERYDENIDIARTDFTQAMDVFGALNFEDRAKISNDQLFAYYKELKDQSPDRDMEELDIEASYQNSYMGDPNKINHKFRDKITEYIEKKVEETTVSFLFSLARQQGAKPFNKELELRQIREVYHNLVFSDHGGMDTGEGKTRVDIPSYTNVKSILYPKEDISPSMVVTSADNKTTQEVHGEVVRFQKEIKFALSKMKNENARTKLINRIKIIASPNSNQDSPENAELSNLEKVLLGSVDPLSWMQIQDASIGSITLSDLVFSTTNSLQHAIDSLGSSALDTTDVLMMMKKGSSIRVEQKTVEPPNLFRNINDAFAKGMPTVVADEVHMADQSPYQTEVGAIEKNGIRLNLEHQEVRDSLCQYLVLKLFEGELIKHPEKTKSLLTYDEGTVRLTNKGIQELSRLRKKWREDIDLSKSSKKKSPTIIAISKIFESDIKQSFEFIDEKPIDQLIDLFKNTIVNKENTDFTELSSSRIQKGMTRSERFIYSVDQELTNLIDGYLGSIQPGGGEGSFYITPDLLIDHLRGILLRSHRFSSDVSFFLNALEGKSDISVKRNIATKINFYTWLAMVNQNNFIGLSNDLFYTDPDSGKRVLSTLGRVLEKYTEGRAVDLSAKKTGEERLPIPIPQIIKGNDKLIDKIGQDLSGAKKPELVVIWNENTAQELLENLQKQGKKAVLINSQTLEDEADQYQYQFANYGIDVLITTGRKSFAADFKDNNGRFTDFRVTVVNPETISQVGQAYGRLRLPKKVGDFSLYFEKNNLLILASSVLKQEQESPFFSSVLGKADPYFIEIRTLLNKKTKLNEDEQNRLKKITIEVLRINQNKISYDWEKLVEDEIFFIQTISPMIKEAKKKIFFEDYDSQSSHVRKLIKNQVDEVLKKYHLSGSYGSKLREEAEKLALNQFALIDESVINTYYQDVSFTAYNPAIQKDKTIPKGFLIDQTKKRIDDYKREWRFDLVDTDGFFFQEKLAKELEGNLDFYGQMLSQASSYLDKLQIPAYKVDKFILLDSPPYEAENSQLLPQSSAEETLPACHDQAIGITIKDGQTARFIKSGPSTWQKANAKKFERDLIALNRLSPDYFKDKKYVDIYFDIRRPTTKFLRLVINE